MSAVAWRQAGMSYLRYSNLCAEVVRDCLKEPHYSKVRLPPIPSVAFPETGKGGGGSDEPGADFLQAKSREAVFYKTVHVDQGKETNTGAPFAYLYRLRKHSGSVLA